jgi:two-component system, OmpR family, heavy metal sensor histidine kinase CusS
VKLRSFRLRIAVLSAALAGSALVGFGGLAWRLIYVAKVNRLDASLENQIKRAARPRSPDWWQPFETSLARELGADTNTPIALLAMDETGTTLYQSETWSAEFNVADRFPPMPQLPAGLFPDEHNPLKTDRRAPFLPDAQPPTAQLKDFLPDPQIIVQQTRSGNWHIALASFPHTKVAIAVSLQAIDQEMVGIRNIFLVVIAGMLLLVAGGAGLLSGSALRPIQKLTTAIRQVTVAGLDQQVLIGETDIEFVELIQVFNQMLDRLERSFKQASRFSGDAAHELKTPLAILQGELERALQQADSGSEMQQTLSNLLDEVRRLSGIVRKLLLLSLADAGQMSLYPVEVNLSEILVMITEDMELLAPHLAIESDIAADLWVRGDRDLLTQILQNLISNAIKYNLPQGWIKIHGSRQGKAVLVTITNASKPIPLSDRDRIFDRFYRGDLARTRKVEGVGLGLSLSREIARAHQGDLVLDWTSTDQTAFTLTLPC